MKITEHLTSAVTQVGDFMTLASQDVSGMLSVLNDMLGPVPKPDVSSKLETRASAAGMIETIRLWQKQDDAPPATEAEIRQFFTPDELDQFSHQTGLSNPATLNMLQTLLPKCVRRRALHQPFKPVHYKTEGYENAENRE
nr:YidB family protein [uncultured Acetobacter sp.]